jgi:hypothetical protein
VGTLPLLTLMLCAPPAIKAPALAVGDELVFAGDIVEESLRQDQPYKRQFKIAVRGYVLRTFDGGADVAVQTAITPVEDAIIAKTAVDVAGASKHSKTSSAVRLELLRVQNDGATLLLTPEASPPPLALTAKTKTLAVPPPNNDSLTTAEHGVFPHRPLKDPKPAIVLDGTEVIEFATTHKGGNWTIAERVWIGPADGLARVLWRQAEHIGKGVKIEMRLDLQPVVAHRGRHAEDVQREVEFAWWFGTQIGKQDAAKLQGRIDRFTADHPATEFRPAVESVARRLKAN